MKLVCFFIIFSLLDLHLHSNWRSISLPATAQHFASRIDGLARSNLPLALAFTLPTFNKLLLTLTNGTYFLVCTILYVAVRRDCRLTISFFVTPLAAPRLLLGNVCEVICSPGRVRASVAETSTTCPPICAFPRLSPHCGAVVPLSGFLSRIPPVQRMRGMVYQTGGMFGNDTVLYRDLRTILYCITVPLSGNHRHDCIYSDTAL
jgi:hypothetical protein